MIDLKELTIKKAHKHLIDGEFSATDLAGAYLEAIKRKNKELNAYLEVYDDVLEQAAVADKMIKDGKATILTGIPLAVKDNILIKGRRASAASKILDGYVASYDATVIVKLKEAGAVFLGRTNMDEFAMGSSTENSAFGPSKNPHDTSRVPGGSSGGSAAAVAGGLAIAALGSDTGGSIRQPASFCGLVGFKPTYGAVSRYGLMAMASSFDVIGPITKNAEDAEIIFDCIKGRDSMDSTSADFKFEPKKKLVVGSLRHFIDEVGAGGVSPEVLKNYNESLDRLAKLGYELREVSLRQTPIGLALAAYYIIMPAEASTNLARFDGVKYGLYKDGGNLLEDYRLTRGEGFGREVRRRILLGSYVLSSGYYDAYYNKAVQTQQLIRDTFNKAFKDVDILVTPTTPTPAFKIGEKASDPLSMYLADIFTVSANIAGVPAISVPSGTAKTDGKELPLGVQFIASAGSEQMLFDVARDFSKM